MVTFFEFTDFTALSDTLAKRWLTRILETPVDQPCSFALAGGTTPAPLYRHFDALFAASDARSVQLLATDERWVDDADPASNEGLFSQCFASSASKWSLLSLKNQDPDPVSALNEIDARLASSCPHPFCAVILGMGTDGHIASLFPDQPQLFNKAGQKKCVAVLHPQTGQARISLSFSRLLNTTATWLVITGSEKRRVLETAAQTAEGPIGALLLATDVEVFWCP